LASVPHSFKQEHATVPPIVLPITSRGLTLTDRACWGILGAAMAIAAALILYLNRGTTFFADELTFLYETPALGPREAIEPHNGHLIATTRLAYKLILETVGPDYIAFRLIAVGAVLLSGGLFYAVVKRRIGALAALAPTFVLLVFGSAWQHVLAPIGFTPILAIAAGLAALLALERGDRPGDVAACALLVFSIATYTTGLPFLVGVAVSVLIRPDRRKRAWIFLVPLALYGAWWLWSLSTDTSAGNETRLANVLLIPAWVAESLAAVTGALTGLGFPFSGGSESKIDPDWGRVLAIPLIVALVLRIRRGNVPAGVWVSLGVVLTWWTLGAIAYDTFRPPDSGRYIYMGSIGVLLVAAAAADAIRFTRLGLAALFGVCVLSIAANLELLRAGERFLRNYSTVVRADLAMAELAGNRADPDFKPLRDAPLGEFINAPISSHLVLVDEFGPIGFSPSELGAQDEPVREAADRVLANAYGLRLTKPANPPPLESCRVVRPRRPSGPIVTELPAGGAAFLARGSGGAVSVGRFGSVGAAEVGGVSPGRTAVLPIPTDSAPQPWRAAMTGPSSIEVCALRQPG